MHENIFKNSTITGYRLIWEFPTKIQKTTVAYLLGHMSERKVMTDACIWAEKIVAKKKKKPSIKTIRKSDW